MNPDPPLGATPGPDGSVRFLVWAPKASERVHLALPGADDARLPMAALKDGYWAVTVPDLAPGTRYGFSLDGGSIRPDPASRSQPDGVHGLSEVVDPSAFHGSDSGWRGIPRRSLVLYELHVGTFTRPGTFESASLRFAGLSELGITAVELLPVAAFPGVRNWGYDGVYPFAVQGSYGGLPGLRRLTEAAHAAGLAVLLDIVPNHVGPEGSYLSEFGPYFSGFYQTPWGSPLNFDGAGSDEVRRFFVESAVFLLEAAHLDGVRVDAVHAIVDPTASPFLAELTDALHASPRARDRPLHVLAESALNDPRVIRPSSDAGWGFDAVWNDDFHHAVHHLVTGERQGYYVDYADPDALRVAWNDAWYLDGRFSAFRGRRHGAPAARYPPDRFVVSGQNHDQVGNRPFGDRLTTLVPAEAARLALALVLLSPSLPMLFMGEEYGETAPFLYFTDHQDPAVVEGVRTGRRSGYGALPPGRMPPDPQDPGTFERSRLDHDRAATESGRQTTALVRTLLSLRREMGGASATPGPTARWVGAPGILLRVDRPDDGAWMLFRVTGSPSAARVPVDVPEGSWSLRIDSDDQRWGGPGTTAPAGLTGPGLAELRIPGWGFVVYRRAAPGA